MSDTALAAQLRAFVQTWPGIIRVEGQSDPRNIAGTSDPSEHTWGNALDIYGSRETLMALAEHLDQNRRKYSIQVLCYDPGLGRKYDHCTTKHTDHIHVDFRPHCGGRVSGNGSGADRANRCNQFQTGGNMNRNGDPNYRPNAGNEDDTTGIGFDPLAGISEAISSAFGTGVLVVLGVVLAGAGIALLIKDTALAKNAVGAVKTIATKGAA